jgi:Transcriptional Coactivator p15 (PC4)
MSEPLKGTDVTQAPQEVLAARVRVNAATEIQVRTQQLSGRCYIHIRQYFLSDDNEFRPTTKGIALPIEKLADVLEAVQELRALAPKAGVAAKLVKNGREEVRFSVVEWKGTTKADIRTYFARDGADERSAGRGVRFNLGLLPEIERGLESLDRAANRQWPSTF